MATPEQIAEIKRLRGLGWSQQQIADEVGLSRQAVAYQLKKLKESSASSKPVRVIRVQNLDAGPRVFTLDANAFEAERKSEEVYQLQNNVYEMRSGCMHMMTLTGPAKGGDYAEWAPVFRVGAQLDLLNRYEYLTVQSLQVSKYLLFSAHRTEQESDLVPRENVAQWRFKHGGTPAQRARGLRAKVQENPETSATGVKWLVDRNYDSTFFEQHGVEVTKRLMEMYHEQKMEPLKLSGDAIKDILELHSIFGDVEKMQEGIASAQIVAKKRQWYSKNLEKAVFGLISDLGFKKGDIEFALKHGCYDPKILSNLRSGGWNSDELHLCQEAQEAGFDNKKDAKAAERRGCINKLEFDVVRDNGWKDGGQFRDAKGKGFHDDEAELYASVASKNIHVKWARKNPHYLDRLDDFPSVKAIELYDSILKSASDSLRIDRLLQLYQQSKLPGPEFQSEEQIEEVLKSKPFNKICKVDPISGMAIVSKSSVAGSKKKAGAKSVVPGVDYNAFVHLSTMKNKLNDELIRELNERQLDDSLVKAFKRFEFYAKKCWKANNDDNLPRTNTNVALVDYVCETLGVSAAQTKRMHKCRMIRNNIEHPEDGMANGKPTWPMVKLLLKFTEDIIAQ